jgi:hypothetical protein
VGSMRKAGGLAGVGEGEREGTPYQQNSIDKRFKTTLCRVFPQN